MRTRLFTAVIGASALLLSGCGADAAGSKAAGSDAEVSILASTNVWGDVARQVGGSAVSVTSVISDSSKDPHSYEVTPQDKLHLSKADLVIENGGGYDDFMGRLEDSLGDGSGSGPRVIDAVKVSGVSAHDGELNEHVWYDFDAVTAVAKSIASAIEKQAPDEKKHVQARLHRFVKGVATLEGTESELKKKFGGDSVAITEPVPLYMLESVGLANRTPDAFSEAVEEGGDVSPAVLKNTLGLFTDHKVKALFYNTQSTDDASESIKAAAHKNDIPVVGVAETRPKGKDYLEWMADNLDNVKRALSR